MTATEKTGRVMKLSDVKGVMEYRFVPSFDWTPPRPFGDHATWFMFDPVRHADDYAKIRQDMIDRAERLKTWCQTDWDGTASWYSYSGTYVAKVTYDEAERPILVLIGGL